MQNGAGLGEHLARTGNLDKIPDGDCGGFGDDFCADKTESLSDVTLKHVDWPSPNDNIPFWKRKFLTSDANPEAPVNIEKDSDLLHVIHVTAEMAPIAKVGGLGDVVTGLARACLLRGHKVDIMLPFYECIRKENIQELSLCKSSFKSYYDGNWVETNAYSGIVSDIPVILVEPMNQFFKGEDVTGTQPDIIHVHEWQTGALPLLYWDMYHYLSLQKPRIVLTIHNMEHYGECRNRNSWGGRNNGRFMIIDAGSSDNIASTEMMDQLGLGK
ncbi:glycogen synthase-like protein isoform X1 [Tanacetum coccineum]